MSQLSVKCPGCPAEAPGISGVNQADLVRQLESHIEAKHKVYAGVSALGTRGQTGSSFWAPWYVGTNCHS